MKGSQSDGCDDLWHINFVRINEQLAQFLLFRFKIQLLIFFQIIILAEKSKIFLTCPNEKAPIDSPSKKKG